MERGLLKRVGELLLTLTGSPCAVMLAADDTTYALYGPQVETSLRDAGFSLCRFVFSHGEDHKDLATWESLLQAMAQSRLAPTDWVLALGGGVTGDLAGFAAATYLRGIPFVQVPTTLLAMVDSSVGGKTAVNLSTGKNLVGAFHQPSAVFCDPDTLGTLPTETLRDGVAEALKTAMLGDAEMFDMLAFGDYQSRISEIIGRCVQIKAGLVGKDEHDQGSRKLLNFGHTLGHAIERASDYRFSHGQAVSVGMVYATRLAWKLGLCARECLDRVTVALQNNGLPIWAPYTAEELLCVALSDKKRAGGELTWVLPRAVGECVLYPAPIGELEPFIRMAMEEGGTP